MDLETLRKAARLIFRSSLIGKRPTVLWHAGEPLLVGIEWFKQAVRIIDEENVHGVSIKHSIQTNGVLIDARWCQFFRSNSFEIGISADGPSFVHDVKRRNWGDRGSFGKMQQGLAALRAHGLSYAGICVLTEASLPFPDEIFEFFLNENFSSVGFNAEEIEGFNTSSSLSRPHSK
jgi:uncharacterized protein